MGFNTSIRPLSSVRIRVVLGWWPLSRPLVAVRMDVPVFLGGLGGLIWSDDSKSEAYVLET